MILILLLEVRNLKKITTTIALINSTNNNDKIIIIIIKTITKIKLVMKIKFIVPRHHQSQKKLFSCLEAAW